MAKKDRIQIDGNTRKKIKASLIIKKLSDHIHDAEKTPLLNTQVKAAQILLNKILPDLKSMDLTAEVQANLTVIRKVYKLENKSAEQ